MPAGTRVAAVLGAATWPRIESSLTLRQALSSAAVQGLRHEALFYRTPAEFVSGTTRFIRNGLDSGDPVLVAVPGHVKIESMRAATTEAERIQFADMAEVGVNPARIIPFVQRFADEHAARRLWFIGEPIWPERTSAEYR